MTSRERILAAFECKKVDRVPYDLTMGRIWPELADYFLKEFGLEDCDAIFDFLGVDCRWIEMRPRGWIKKNKEGKPVEIHKNKDGKPSGIHEVMDGTLNVSSGPMKSAKTIDDVERLWTHHLLPEAFDIPDFKAYRERWPNHAIMVLPFAAPYFWSSCGQFGMDEAFFKMVDAPEVFDHVLKKLAVDSKRRLIAFLEKAKGYVDVIELWDDMAGQWSMMVDPEWWRRVMKPYLAAEVRLIHDYGMKCLFHSCGAVRPIIKDFIEIGIDAHEVFQINAAGMEPRGIAKDFGGRLAFFGGIDVQHLLSYGTKEDVARQVRHNIDCFKDCGGYIVANCHSGVKTIKGENIVTMCKTARNSGSALAP